MVDSKVLSSGIKAKQSLDFVVMSGGILLSTSWFHWFWYLMCFSQELQKLGKLSPEQSCSLCIRADEVYGNLKGHELQLMFSLYSTSHQPPQRITDIVILKLRHNPQQAGVFLVRTSLCSVFF